MTALRHVVVGVMLAAGLWPAASAHTLESLRQQLHSAESPPSMWERFRSMP